MNMVVCLFLETNLLTGCFLSRRVEAVTWQICPIRDTRGPCDLYNEPTLEITQHSYLVGTLMQSHII